MDEWHAFLIGLSDGLHLPFHRSNLLTKLPWLKVEWHYYSVGSVVGHYLPYLFILGLGILIGRLI